MTLIGDGPVHNELKTLAKTLGISQRCAFVGEKPQRELPEWYARADVFVYPSMTETFGQVVSESLWMGTPVVGFDDGMGVAHQVKHEENGLLVQAGKGEAEGFGAAILRVLTDDDMRRAFGVEAARRQRTTSAPEVVYAAYENAYGVARDHIAAHPPAPLQAGKLSTQVHMTRHHVLPWLSLHTALVATGAVPTSYKPRTDVPIDAAPVNPADESYAHRGGQTPLPPKPTGASADAAEAAVVGSAELAVDAGAPQPPVRARRASTTTRRSRVGSAG